MHNSAGLVSVIVPIYNSGLYLEECIESVLSQTYNNFELILVNDGSTDNSQKVCESYLEDKRVKLFMNSNHGVSYSRNYGIQRAVGEFIVFVDSDDTIDADLLKKLVEGIQETDFCICGMVKEYLSSNSVARKDFFSCQDAQLSISAFLNNLELYLAKQLVQGPCGKIFRKKIIDRNGLLFPENMSYGEDSCFVHSYLKYIQTVSVISDCLYHYKVRDRESLDTRLREDKIWIVIQLMEDLAKVFEFHAMKMPEDLAAKRIQLAYIVFFDQSSFLDKKRFTDLQRKINKNPTVRKSFDTDCGGVQTKIVSFLIKNNFLFGEYIFFQLKRLRRRSKNP